MPTPTQIPLVGRDGIINSQNCFDEELLLQVEAVASGEDFSGEAVVLTQTLMVSAEKNLL